jgi:acyl dehydratase
MMLTYDKLCLNSIHNCCYEDAVHFKKPVYFGDTIACNLTITKIDKKGRSRAKAVYKNQHGVIVLEADLEGILPGGLEREILAVP